MKLNLSSSNKAISQFQWLLLAKILEHHSSVKDAFEILLNNYPKNLRIKTIYESLSAGEQLNKVLSFDEFSTDLAFYVDYLPLEKSILLVKAQKDIKNEFKNQLTTRIRYQLVLLLSSFVLLSIFSKFVLPGMIINIDSNNQKAQSLLRNFGLLRVFRNTLLVAFLIIIGFGTYVFVAKKEVYVWNYLHLRNKDQPIKVLVSLSFSQKLKCMLEQGISFIDALKILRFRKKNSLISLLAHHFDETLLSGEQFEKSLDLSFFDDNFHSLCIYGLRDDDFIRSLDDYISYTQLLIMELLRKVSLAIQVFCYSFVALTILQAYQVILLPLELLERL